MKAKFFFSTALSLLLLVLTLPLDSLAQGKGKPGPPPWAPAHGYRAKTRHVYFPGHNFYYDVQKGVYIYLSGGQWLIRPALPTMYASVNLREASWVELDLNTDAPHKFNGEHKGKYKGNPKGGNGPGPGHANGKPGGGPGKGKGKGK
jgi:hypothetical protein